MKKRGAYRSFAELVAYVIQDGLTDDKVPMVQRSGGSAIGFVDRTVKPSLAEIRNKQAHSDSLDGFSVGGLLELVRDLIVYAYRDFHQKKADGRETGLTREWPRRVGYVEEEISTQ